ncbi:MAG: hypothetical protein QM766_19750 [Burkholderiaceae bacterium]
MEQPIDDLQAFAHHAFTSQPCCRYIGAHSTAATADSAELSLTIQEHHKQQHDLVASDGLRKSSC